MTTMKSTLEIYTARNSEVPTSTKKIINEITHLPNFENHFCKGNLNS